MIGSNDSNEPKEIEQITLQKRGDGFEREKGVEFYKNAVDRINKNLERLRKIIEEHLSFGSSAMVTQELLSAVQNEIGVVIDLSLSDINNIANTVFQFFVSDADLGSFIENSNLNPVTKTIFTQVFASGGVENISTFEGYDLLSDQDKEFLDLANYMAGNNSGVTTDSLIECSVFGIPSDCWLAGGVAGAAVGGVPGAIVGVVVGAVLDVVSK